MTRTIAAALLAISMTACTAQSYTPTNESLTTLNVHSIEDFAYDGTIRDNESGSLLIETGSILEINLGFNKSDGTSHAIIVESDKRLYAIRKGSGVTLIRTLSINGISYIIVYYDTLTVEKE